MRVGLFIVCLGLSMLLISCSEDSPTDPGPQEPQSIDVVFTYVKVTTTAGCCDPGTEGGEVGGELRVQKTGENYVKLYGFGGTLSSYRNLGKSHAYTITDGEVLTAFSSGLHENDDLSGDEQIDEFTRRWTFAELIHKLPDAEAEIVEVMHCDGDGSNCWLDIHCRIARAP